MRDNREAKALFAELNSLVKIESAIVVSPHIDVKGIKLVIVLVKLCGGGFITGCACENTTNIDAALLRALYEMSRHALAYQSAIENKLCPSTFYEERLFFFASGKGNQIVKNRLESGGAKLIILPETDIDEEIVHPLSDSVACYRVHFKGQPPFIGGDIKRLCI